MRQRSWVFVRGEGSGREPGCGGWQSAARERGRAGPGCGAVGDRGAAGLGGGEGPGASGEHLPGEDCGWVIPEEAGAAGERLCCLRGERLGGSPRAVGVKQSSRRAGSPQPLRKRGFFFSVEGNAVNRHFSLGPLETCCNVISPHLSPLFGLSPPLLYNDCCGIGGFLCCSSVRGTG